MHGSKTESGHHLQCYSRPRAQTVETRLAETKKNKKDRIGTPLTLLQSATYTNNANKTESGHRYYYSVTIGYAHKQRKQDRIGTPFTLLQSATHTNNVKKTESGHHLQCYSRPRTQTMETRQNRDTVYSVTVGHAYKQWKQDRIGTQLILQCYSRSRTQTMETRQNRDTIYTVTVGHAHKQWKQERIGTPFTLLQSATTAGTHSEQSAI